MMTRVGVAETLWREARRGSNGVLTVMDGTAITQLHLRGGRLAFASANSSELRIGRLLCSEGFVSEDDLSAGLQQSERTRALLGDVLVSRGRINPTRLALGLRVQAERIALASLDSGALEMGFSERILEPRGLSSLRLGVANLIMEAARQGKLPWLEGRPPDPETIYCISSRTEEILVGIRLASDERRLLACLDAREVFGVISEVGDVRYEDASRILNAFLLLGLVHYSESRAGDPMVEVPDDLELPEPTGSEARTEAEASSAMDIIGPAKGVDSGIPADVDNAFSDDFPAVKNAPSAEPTSEALWQAFKLPDPESAAGADDGSTPGKPRRGDHGEPGNDSGARD